MGAFPTASFALMTPALERLAQEHHALTVGVVEADAEQTLPALRSGELDLVWFLLSLVRVGQAFALLPDLVGAGQDERVAVRSIVGGDLKRTIYTVGRAGSARRPSVIALRRTLAPSHVNRVPRLVETKVAATRELDRRQQAESFPR